MPGWPASGRGRRDHRERRAADGRQHAGGAGAIRPHADRAARLFFAMCSSASTPELREIETEIRPEAHCPHRRHPPGPSAVRQDRRHRCRSRRSSGSTRRWTTWSSATTSTSCWPAARLDDAGRARLTELNQQISTISTTFQQNLMSAMEDAALLLTDVADLDGAGERCRRRREGGGRGSRAGTDTSSRCSCRRRQPLLGVLPNRDVRRRLFEASVNRAKPGEHGQDGDAGAPTTECSRRGSPHCGPSVRRCSGSRPMPTSRWPIRPPRPARPSTSSLAGWSARRWRTPTPRPRSLGEYRRAGRRRTRAVGLGVLLRAGQGRALLGRHRSAAALFRARPGAPRRRLPRRGACLRHHLPAPAGPRRATTPTSASGRSVDADGAPIGLFLGDYFAREGKRGGAWMSNFVDQSVPSRCFAGGRTTASTCRNRRAAPRCSRSTRSGRCSTSSDTPCTGCSPG